VKHAAPGRWRASVAHPAMCWSVDTIPKPDGLAGPQRGLSSNRNRMQPGRCAALCEPGPAIVRSLSGRRYRSADQRRASCWRIIESRTCWTTFLDSGSKRETASNWSLRDSSGPRSSFPKSS